MVKDGVVEVRAIRLERLMGGKRPSYCGNHYVKFIGVNVSVCWLGSILVYLNMILLYIHGYS